MANSFDPKDLMNDVSQSFLSNQKDEAPAPTKSPKVEILDHEALNANEEEEVVDEFSSRKKRRKDDEISKQELEGMLKEIVEAEKHRSPWEGTISPRSFRSKIISYQAKALAGIVKPLTCPNHGDTVLMPLMDTTQHGEQVVLRCSVITCMYKLNPMKDAKIVNHICDNSD